MKEKSIDALHSIKGLFLAEPEVQTKTLTTLMSDRSGVTMQVTATNQSFEALSSTTAPTTQATGNWFTRMGKALKAWFVIDKEIRIDQVVDRRGEIWWRVYNPFTHELKWMSSQEEVLLWLDNYRHRPNCSL